MSLRAGWQALRESYQLGLQLHKLYRRQVVPALQKNG
jgi:hypothetical protein